MPNWTSATIALKGIWAAAIALAFSALLAALAVQTVRLEGLAVWPISFEGWIATAEQRRVRIAELEDDIDDIEAAQEHAADRARAARLEREKIYSDLAERIDDDADANRADALRAAERFIAVGGVRGHEADRGEGGRAGAGAEDRSAGRAEGAGRATELDDAAGALAGLAGRGLVLVTADDVRICTRNTIKAEAGHALAIGLEEASSH